MAGVNDTGCKFIADLNTSKAKDHVFSNTPSLYTSNKISEPKTIICIYIFINWLVETVDKLFEYLWACL